MRRTSVFAAIVAGSLALGASVAGANQSAVYNWTFTDLNNNPVGSGTMSVAWNDEVYAVTGSINGVPVHVISNFVPGSGQQLLPNGMTVSYANPVPGMATWNLNGLIYETFDNLVQLGCGGPTYVGGIAMYSVRPSTAYEFEQDSGIQTATSNGNTISCSYGNNIVDLWTSKSDGTYTETQGTLTLTSQALALHRDGPAGPVHAGGPGRIPHVKQ